MSGRGRHASDRAMATTAQRTGRVFAVRHGETAWSVSGQHTGSTDIPLTDRGRDLATRLRPVLSGQSFGCALTSPLARARQTCALCGLGEIATIDSDLAEWRYGDYEGLTPAQIEQNAPGWLIFRDGCPGGESPDEVGVRADRLIARVRAVDGDAVLFSHGHLLRVLAARWLGMPPRAGQHFLLDTGTLGVLSYYRSVPAIRTWNAPLIEAFGPGRAPGDKR